MCPVVCAINGIDIDRAYRWCWLVRTSSSSDDGVGPPSEWFGHVVNRSSTNLIQRLANAAAADALRHPRVTHRGGEEGRVSRPSARPRVQDRTSYGSDRRTEYSTCNIQRPWKPGWGFVKVIENVTIRYSAYDFLLTFYSKCGSISCRFWDFHMWKISRPWNPGQGSIKVIEVVPFDRPDIVSYLRSIVTLSLRRTVFEIFDLLVYRNLETRVRGYSRSPEPTWIDPPPITSY